MQLLFAAMKDMSELVWEDPMTSPIRLPGSSVLELLIQEWFTLLQQPWDHGKRPRVAVIRLWEPSSDTYEVSHLPRWASVSVFKMVITGTISHRNWEDWEACLPCIIIGRFRHIPAPSEYLLSNKTNDKWFGPKTSILQTRLLPGIPWGACEHIESPASLLTY